MGGVRLEICYLCYTAQDELQGYFQGKYLLSFLAED